MALTFRSSGTRFEPTLEPYMRNTLSVSTFSTISWQRRSATLLREAQTRIWEDFSLSCICWMASTKVTVVPVQTERQSDQPTFKCNIFGGFFCPKQAIEVTSAILLRQSLHPKTSVHISVAVYSTCRFDMTSSTVAAKTTRCSFTLGVFDLDDLVNSDLADSEYSCLLTYNLHDNLFSST